MSNDNERSERDDNERDNEPWGKPDLPGQDDLRQYLWRDQEGALDGCWTWSRAEAISRAIRLGLTVVERRWAYGGERVAWAPNAEVLVMTGEWPETGAGAGAGAGV